MNRDKLGTFLQHVRYNLKDLSARSGETFVKDGQHIGRGVEKTQNMKQGTTVSRDSKEARHQKLYEDAKLRRLNEDVTEEEIEGIVDRYVNDIINNLFKG